MTGRSYNKPRDLKGGDGGSNRSSSSPPCAPLLGGARWSGVMENAEAARPPSECRRRLLAAVMRIPECMHVMHSHACAVTRSFFLTASLAQGMGRGF